MEQQTALERFPRAKLFAKLASLQSELEEWEGKTAIKIDESEDLGLRFYMVDKLSDRKKALGIARELVTQARVAIYNCP